MTNRTFGRLSPLTVKRVLASPGAPGRIADGGGLYLQTSPNGSVAWIFRYRHGGKRRHMGLGSAAVVSLGEARMRATAVRRSIFDGADPVEVKHGQRTAARLDVAKAMTFAQCAAEAYIAAHRAGWKNKKHAGQWRATLNTYAAPIIGQLPVQAIDTGLVMRVLEPVWSTKPETASRVRGRIESILDWAKVRSYRDGENPARWKGHLDQLLPAKTKVRKVAHHAALPYAELPAFMVELHQRPATAARALQFAILTAARTSEVLGATWEEIDLQTRTWTVPAGRMKGGREHRVPLSNAAVALLGALPKPHAGLIFPGAKRGKPLSNMALLMILRRMDRGDLTTTHGFRSCFTDWAHERTNFPSEAIEMALAHTVSNKVEAAYRRGDLFERRRRLMAEWADFCAGKAAPSTTVAKLRG
jgi:integrase